MYSIQVEGSSVHVRCASDTPVLSAIAASGERVVAVGCRSGGCGVCRVKVLEGSYRTRCMSAAHVSDADAESGIALACQLLPESDLRLRVLGCGRKTADMRFRCFLKVCETSTWSNPNELREVLA